MNKEFNLSERKQFIDVTNGDKFYYQEKDVKEFIKRLKDLKPSSFFNLVGEVWEFDVKNWEIEIDKLIGDELTK